MTPEADGGRSKSILLLQILAYLTLVVFGLKMSGDLLVPILLAALFAIVCLPPTRALQRRGLRPILAIPIVVTGLLMALLVLVYVVGSSISDFTSSMGRYEERFNELLTGWGHDLAGHGVEFSEQELLDLVNTGAVLAFVATALGSVTATLSDILITVLIVVFILFEANHLPAKLRRSMGDPDADLGGFEEALRQVYGYLAVKTGMSVLTGLVAWLLCTVMGVDFPALWGLVAFMFNFIPSIGSIVAAIPPVLLAVVVYGFGRAGLVAAGYLLINMAIGNALEPRLMGRRLGLSPLVILLSLIFWAWLWGPIGMLLSVPLTTVVKILLEHSRDYKPVAAILGPAVDPVETSADS